MVPKMRAISQRKQQYSEEETSIPNLIDYVGLVSQGEWRKEAADFHPPRSKTNCVQPGKYWHCFVCNLGETAERRGGTQMDLSEAMRSS